MKVDQEVIDEVYESLILKFKDMDKVMEELNVPLDLSKIIYSYAKPYCNSCEACCKICQVFCSLDECRCYQRKICIRWSIENRLERYKAKSV